MTLRAASHAFPVVLALLLGSAGAAVAEPPEDPCCGSAEEVYESFQDGVRAVLARRDLEEARGLLCRAACCLPEPDAGRPLAIRGPVRVQYLPHFYLGLCHHRLGDHCQALGSFNLSECKGEVRSHSARWAELRELRAASRRSRPPTAEAFGQGLAAYEAKRWREAAERMAEALESWDEDGEPARLYGRWRTDLPYLPRYFLARALFELGCLSESLRLLGCSSLSFCQLADDAREDPAEVLEELQRRIATAGPDPPELCDRWRPVAAEWGSCCACAECAGP